MIRVWCPAHWKIPMEHLISQYLIWLGYDTDSKPAIMLDSFASKIDGNE